MLPNFIVIGAAKAGTTALYWYLEEHPDVFMSPVKETNYFAYGVDEGGNLLYGDPDVHRFPVKTLEEYEQLFNRAGGARAVGEASPLYLECPQAAARIRNRLPDVRLICSIRHPVDRAYSDYLMYLRRRGRVFDPDRQLTRAAEWARPDSRWMQVSRYYQQLARYFAAFPRDQIHVMLFDDFKTNTCRRGAAGLSLAGHRFRLRSRLRDPARHGGNAGEQGPGGVIYHQRHQQGGTSLGAQAGNQLGQAAAQPKPAAGAFTPTRSQARAYRTFQG